MNNPSSTPPGRLGLNRGGYHGEQIRIWDLLSELESVAPRMGWMKTPLNHPPDAWLPAYSKLHPGAGINIYLSAGIHGDEPAGPLALRRLLLEDALPDRFNYWMIPCLNPDGFERNTRENEDRLDLNRDYNHLSSPRVRAHVRWLSEQPRFDLALLLHEDWEAAGFYLYELNPDRRPSLAERVIERVSAICPIEPASVVDGREAMGGMIRFTGHIPERPDWPEAIWLIHNRTRHNYTLEAPSDYDLPVRVNALTAAVRAALEGFS